MLITAIDQDNNLFLIKNVLSTELVQKVLSTDWLNMPYQKSDPASFRRQIDSTEILWIDQWNAELIQVCVLASQQTGQKLGEYTGTGFWLDEAGFDFACHTDGELPGSIHLYWIGNKNLGTRFYHHKNRKSLRKQFDFEPNSGYILKNQIDDSSYRLLQWHDMPTTVPAGTYRLTSYTWLWYPS
jgi:hypothetical protein